MISIIVCCRYNTITSELTKNILETIGIEHELIIIDNSKNKYSIFSAYNEGLHRAKFPYLCFMHDDILFHTQDWGQKVIEHFKNPKIGVIGVAGGHFIPKTPASWASTKCVSLNIIQNSYEKNITTHNHFTKLEYSQGRSTDVVALDGVWICIPKTLFKTISFDEKTFNSFHFYDLDICFQARKAGYQAQVVNNILIEHFSWGNWDKTWYESANLFFNKWKDDLPQIAGIEISSEEIKTRNEFVSEIFSLSQELNNFQSQLDVIRNSIAYKLGKVILKPFTFLRNKLQ